MLAPAGEAISQKEWQDDSNDKLKHGDLLGDAESGADDDAFMKVTEDGWGWVVEGGSVTHDPAGGTGEGPAAENTDGFLIYDAPFARKPVTEDVASDTGSAPTVYRSEASPQMQSSDEGMPPSPGGSEMLPWDSIPSEEATLLPPAATELACQMPELPLFELAKPQIHLKAKPLVPSFWQMDDVKEKRKLEDEPYSCRCGSSCEILTHGEIVSSAYRATTGPGYLTDAARNTIIGEKEEEVVYLSGSYTVRDVMCASCSAVIGVKYVGARDSRNDYKVGKFLLGQDLLTPAYRSP